MAKMKNGILDGLNGKIGPVVTYQWKGRDCMRSGEVNYHDPQTPKQLNQRRLFGAASKIASGMRTAINIGFRGPATTGQTTERGCFMRTNKQCFSIVNNAVHIDYQALQVAQGQLPGVQFTEPQVQEGRYVSVSFQSECGGQPTDYVLLFAYAPSMGPGLLSLPAKRHQGIVTIDLPRFWDGHEVHLYGFAWDNNLSASDSAFVGTINLPL